MDATVPQLPVTPPLAQLRRVVFFALVALTVGVGIIMMFEIFAPNSITAIETTILVLFVPAFAWIATWLWTAIAGFVLRAARRDPLSLRRQSPPRATPRGAITTRTAIVMPVYNEDVARVLAGLASVYRSLAKTGEIGKFDFFVLSDSSDPEIRKAERTGWAALCRRLNAERKLYYRRRSGNGGGKAGNIADFCRRWGRLYDFMIVLDADSVMTGEAIVRLVLTMQAAPHAGLIQTVPLLARQETLFGRYVQFSAHLCCPLLAVGASFWQMGESNYWGHNAILRISAFTSSCGLPVLPGRPPFGGEILSHDFVEAALMRRRGWRVYMLPEIEGSYEEVPCTIMDFAKRDHRWAQGNMQHLGLLAGRGFHPLSRLHFLLGAFAYLSSTIWLGLLVVGTVEAMRRALVPHEFFSAEYQLYPHWLVFRSDTMLSLLTLTLCLLLLPKALALVLALADGQKRRMFGGAARLVASALAEIVLAALMAPLFMCLHAWYVVTILAGRSIVWMPQDRNGDGLRTCEIAKFFLIPTLVGLIWGGVTFAATPTFFWFLTPALIGLVLSIPLALCSGSRAIGRGLLRNGLFCTPEERQPPQELRLEIDAAAIGSGCALAAEDDFGIPATPPEMVAEMPVQSLAQSASPLSRTTSLGQPLRGAVRLDET